MKQPFLFISILISLSICFSCEQVLPETSDQSDEEVSQNENNEENSDQEESTKENNSSNFMASMRNSKQINTYIEAANGQLVAAMDATVAIKVQYQPLVVTAFQIQTLNKEFHQYIHALKELIAQESKGVYTQFDPETKGNIDLIGMPKDGRNKKVVEQVFLSGQYGGVNTQEQQGPVLYKKLAQLRKDYLDVISNMWEDDGVKGTVFADLWRREKLLAQLSDNISLMDYNSPSNETNWIKTNFRNKTIEDAYLSLTQCQNQVNLSTAAVLNFLSEQMGRLEMTYDKFDVLAQSEKPYVLLGETYEAEIALGAYSSQAKFAVSVGGSGLSVIDGKARYSVRATSVGEKSYNAKLSVVNPLTGERETFIKTFKYEVGQPAMHVSADRQNILYIGVDNPVTIAAAGITTSSIKVSMTGGSLQKKSSTGYIAKVSKPGKVIITIKDIKTGKSFPFQFRAKRLPDPVLRLGKHIDGQISSGEFKAQAGLSAPLENFDIDARCQIKSYHLSYIRKRQDAVSLKGSGARFVGDVASAISQAKPGDQYSFTEMKVRCPGDPSDRRVNGLSFRIK